jgi:hypothetical protein
MRSLNSIPNNPWPHDMRITVDDQADPLLELLWIREAYDLEPRGDDLPPLLSHPPLGEALRPPTPRDREEWTSAWPALWAAAVSHAGKEADFALHERLTRTANGSQDRIELLRELVGPSWRDEFGSEALDPPSYREWREGTVAPRPPALEDNPLVRDLDGVVVAWRAGMTKIITIPCDGEYTRRVGDNALLITEQTMTSSDAFRRALGAFA